MTNDNEEVANVSTGDDSRFVNRRRTNVSSDLIEITEDKLENILLKHLDKVNIRRSWLAPLGILTSVVLAVVTADFTDKLLPASTWQALFVLASVLSVLWLIVNLIRIAVCWKQSTTDYLIGCIKASEDEE